MDDREILFWIQEFKDLKAEVLQLKNEQEEFKQKFENINRSSSIHSKAREAIQSKKMLKINAYREKICKIVSQNRDITTKELIKELQINNKTFYNLKLNEFFNNGEGI